MRITADTNLLVRAVLFDDERQAAVAIALLQRAALIAIPVTSLCEMVWVLRTGYGRTRGEVAAAITTLLSIASVVTDRGAAQAGLAMLDAGGDFADGAIAYEGAMLGGDLFVSFDRAAVRHLVAQGRPAQLAGEV